MSDIYLKIHQGTGKLTGESLCSSCEQGSIYHDERGEHRICGTDGMFTPRPIHGKVTSCTDYYNKGLPSLRQMETVAWTLRTEKGGKTIGFAFIPPKPKKDDD